MFSGRFSGESQRGTLALVFLFVLGGSLAGGKEVWNINNRCLFDATNKAYQMNDGNVTVDLRGEGALCPTGLGHLVSGRVPVKEIRFVFASEAEGRYWLHIGWEPGGSGTEQFEVRCNSGEAARSTLADAAAKPNQSIVDRFGVTLKNGASEIALRHLSGDGLRFRYIFLSASEDESSSPLLSPDLKFPTLKAYEAECKEPGIMLDDRGMRLFAPKRKAKEAQIIFGYLVKAYDELQRIVGSQPEYKLVVYHFPEGSEHAWGGTSECVIWYGYKNLELDQQEEWTRYKVPHLSGYIEEMAHNFDGSLGVQFGWEMTGWNLGVKTTQKVGNNPIFAAQIRDTRATQSETFRRYVTGGCKFPDDLPGNLCDRIHAHLLWMCERMYGPTFWEDFFHEAQKERENLEAAKYLGDADKVRNRKYQITVECFDRLEKIQFRKMLKEYQLSQTTAIKSLRPTEPGWDRRFLGPDER